VWRSITITAALHLNGGLSSMKVSKKHLKASQTVRNKILWSDETEIELFGLSITSGGNTTRVGYPSVSFSNLHTGSLELNQ